jgi:hypothetical protein
MDEVSPEPHAHAIIVTGCQRDGEIVSTAQWVHEATTPTDAAKRKRRVRVKYMMGTKEESGQRTRNDRRYLGDLQSKHRSDQDSS